MNYKTKVLWGIILLGLALRLVNLFSPLLDLYPIRQEYCAMVARNFFRHGLNIFNPQADWAGNLNSYWSIELPIISFLAALLYKIFGLHEYLGRVVAIIFSLGSIFFFYKLARLYFQEKAALISTFCFTVLPLNLYLSRAFMPESPTMFFALLAMYVLSLWARQDKPWLFISSIVTVALALLAKVSSLYLGLPILFLFYLKYGWRMILNWRIYAFTLFVGLAVFFWYSRSHLEMAFYTHDPENFGYLLRPDFYRRMFESLAIFVLTPLGLILCVFGSLLKVQKREQYLFHLWLLGLFIYTLLFPKINYVHFHYQLPFSVPGAVFIGRALGSIVERDLAKQTILANIFKSRQLIAIILIMLLAASLLILTPCYKYSRSTYEACRLINKLTPKDSVIIAGRCTQEAPLYYCDRKGWVINEEGGLSYVYGWRHKDPGLKNFPRLEEVELVKYLIKNGAGYYLAANLTAFNANPQLVQYLKQNFKILRQGDKYIIFALR